MGNMRAWQWIAATAIASVIMLSYVHAFIYPRTEGEKMERRVDKLERTHETDIHRIYKELSELNKWLRENHR